jgi:hypothetical protein
MAAEETKKRLEAARLMREAAKLLEDSEKKEDKKVDTATASTTEELRKLFAPYSTERKNPCQTVQNPKPAKRKRTSGWFPMFNPSPTWTHRFCLLADKNASVAPTVAEKEKLKAAGLGEQKITFENKKGNHHFLTEVLEEKFPLLKKTGGFLLCRTAGGQRLQVIPPGKNGYSIPYLRDESSLRQAVAYIRPLQLSIDIHHEEEQVSSRFQHFLQMYCIYILGIYGCI